MATSAKETAKQENGSRVFFESVIEKGKEPPDKEMFKVYDNYSLEWKLIYRKQVAAVKEYIKSENFDNLNTVPECCKNACTKSQF